MDAKNSLESYCFDVKATVEDEKVKDKVSEEDRRKVINACNETIKWLDMNQLAEKEEFQHKQKEMESLVNPIVRKMYESGGGMAGGMPGSCGMESGFSGSRGPTVEEVD